MVSKLLLDRQIRKKLVYLISNLPQPSEQSRVQLQYHKTVLPNFLSYFYIFVKKFHCQGFFLNKLETQMK